MLRVGAVINGFIMLFIQDKKLVHYVIGKNQTKSKHTGLFIPRVGANIYGMKETDLALKIFVFDCFAFNLSFH